MEQLNRLRESVFQEKPVLRKLVEKNSDISLFEYAIQHYHYASPSGGIFLKRQEEFFSFFEKYVQKKFGAKIASEVLGGLLKNYSITTADHHGPIGHSFFFQSAILRGLSFQNNPIINFCTSHVSLGNSSYPRGIVFHGDGAATSESYLTLPFFAAKERMCPVYNHSPIQEDNIIKYTLPRLMNYLTEGLISLHKKNEIEGFLKEILPQIFGLKTYSEQITQLNYFWWKKIFREKLPDLFCFDAEDIAKNNIIECFSEKGPIYEIIYNPSLSPFVEEYFNAISCCFNRVEQHGSYLFWYLDEHHMRHPLWRDGKYLKNITGTYTIELSPACINEQLRAGKLIPSGLLVYTIFDCYYGLRCFGGFSQGQYLGQIRNGYKQLQIDSFSNTNPTDIICEDMVFCFSDKGKILTALDMTLANHVSSFEEIISEAKKITIACSIDAMIPEIARCLKI